MGDQTPKEKGWSAVIGANSAKELKIEDFFKCIKVMGIGIASLRAVVPVVQGIETSFVDEARVRRFMERVPPKWEVKSDAKREVLVTITPRMGERHVAVSDDAMSAALARGGGVVKYRRLCYQEAPGVETGVRQALMEAELILLWTSRFCLVL